MFWHATYEVARKEFLQLLRTRRLLVIGALLLASLLFTTVVVPVLFFNLDQAADPGELALENQVFLIFLNAPIIGGYFFIQLLAIVLVSDGVVSEWQRRTIFLLLSKPVPRSAFVLGKFLGSVVPLAVAFTLLFALDYGLLQILLPGTPTGAQAGRFFGGVGLIVLGVVAFAAMGLFFSTLTRSSVASLVATLAFAFLVFPLLGGIGDFVRIADSFDGGVVDETAPRYDWSHYLNPGLVMVMAGDVISEGSLSGGLVAFIPQNAPVHLWLSIVSTVGFAASFIGLSLLSVWRRDFE